MSDLSLGVIMAALGAGLAAIMAGIGSIIGIGYPGRAAAGQAGGRYSGVGRVRGDPGECRSISGRSGRPDCGFLF